MGMYTEIYLTVALKTDTPEIVINALRHLFDGAPDPTALPDHQFFKCDRWSMIGRCSSFYFVPQPTSAMWKEGHISSRWYITSRSDLKNYGQEIQMFFDFIMPYIDAPEGEFIGYSRYEEDEAPKLYFKAGA